MPDSGSFLEPAPPASAYQPLWLSAPGVNARLLSLGVRRHDVDDLRQEVFLVALKRRPQLSSSAAANAWLSEVCQFVARAHRRKAHRRRELPELIGQDVFHRLVSPDADDVSEDVGDRLHAALAGLSAREREILALRLAADMPFRSLADLHECDVKTVRKRFRLAEAKLRQKLLTAGTRGLRGRSDSARAASARDGRKLVDQVDAQVAVGAHDSTLIVSWGGPFTERALERFLAQGETLAQGRGRPLHCLSVVEPAWPVPRFEERLRILEFLRFLDAYCDAFSLVGVEHNYRVADQILRGLGFLEQTRYSLGSFKSIEAGASWLVARREPAEAVAVRANELIEAVHETRQRSSQSSTLQEGLESPGLRPPPPGAELVVHGVESSLAIVSHGNVLVTSWLGPVTQVAVNFLGRVADRLRADLGPLAHLSVVEPESPPPRFAERQRLLEVARHCKRNLGAFAFVARVSNQRIAEQIMRGMGFLVRNSLELYAAKGERDGAEWLVKHGYGASPEPTRSVELMLDALARARSLRNPAG